MEETTIENTSHGAPSPSTKIDKTNAEEEAVASASNNQPTGFRAMDELYFAAAGSNIKKFENHAKYLDQILTPNGNTILHIHISSPPPKTAEPNNKFGQRINPKKKSEEGTHPEEAKFANHKGDTLLHFAARHGRGAIVEELIDQCKKPYNKDQERGVEASRLMLGKINEAKDTALHQAVRYNHVDVVDKLIEAEPDLPYDANDSGETPLYLAAERGYPKIVKKILDRCESPAHRGPIGRTALHAAVIRKDEEMTKDLLVKKENLTGKEDEEGRLPLHYAAYLGYTDILNLLLQKDPCTAYKADKEGKRAIHLAAGNGKANAVEKCWEKSKLISKCPCCCELVDNKGCNALHFALASENYHTVKLLLNNPSIVNLVNQKDEKGNAPLHQLADSGTLINYFLWHSSVDKLAFNRNSQNAADIILAKELIMGTQKKFLYGLDTIKKNRCRRIIVPKEEDKEKRNNWLSMLERFRKENVKAKDESDEIIEKIKEAEEPHLVAATLIATVTFAAGFTLPGGYKGDDPNEGAAVLTRSAAFQAFVVFDSTALVLSCLAVLIHLTMALNKDKTRLYKQFNNELRCTFYAMISMMFAFFTGIYAVLFPDKTLALAACVIGCVFGVPLSLLTPAKMVSDMMNTKVPSTTFYQED
ncbi:hypothetical protein ACOSP7_006909 [Xanthoceras sorbifolium]